MSTIKRLLDQFIEQSLSHFLEHPSESSAGVFDSCPSLRRRPSLDQEELHTSREQQIHCCSLHTREEYSYARRVVTCVNMDVCISVSMVLFVSDSSFVLIFFLK